MASAQYVIWTNSRGGILNWSDGANWFGGSPPPGGGGIGVGLQFTNAGSGSATTASNDLAGTFALTTLWFRAGAISLAGNPILFTNNAAVMPVLTNSSGGTRTIANDLIVGTNLFIQANARESAFRLTGNVDLGGAVLRTINVGGGTVWWRVTLVTNTGVMSNGGLLKAGDGLLVLAGANTYSYGTRVEAGTLQFDSLASIGGTGANVTNAGGAIAFNFAGFQDAATTRVGRIDAGSLAISAANSTESVDFRPALFSNAFLGAVGTVIYDHANYTPHVSVANGYGSNQWRFGGGHGTLVVTSAIAGSDSVLIGGRGIYGTVHLAGTNTFTGELRVQDGMHLMVTNPATAPAWGVGAAERIVMSNGTFSIGNVILTNPIVVSRAQANSLYSWTVIRPVPGTTNIVESPIYVVHDYGFQAKVNQGSGAGQHIFSGGVIGTNALAGFYDDVGGNPITLTNRPVLLGTGGILQGHNLIIAVQSNVAGRLMIDWGQGWRLDVADAFVGAPVLHFGTHGSTFINWLDLNSNNITVATITFTNQTAGLVTNHYVTSTNPALFTYHNPTSGFINNFAGRFTGAVSVVKRGAATFGLASPNAHTGDTIVEGGTLQVVADGQILNSPVTVNGGTLLLTNIAALGTAASLTVNAGGAIGPTYGMDQIFIDAAYDKMGRAAPAYALGANSASSISFDDSFRPDLTNSFLGAAPLSNMVFSGTVAWGSDRVRLGGGGGTLVVPGGSIVADTTNLLYVGPVGGDPNSVVVLLTATNYHGLTVLQSGALAITNDAALGTVPSVTTETNIALRGGSLLAVSNNVRLLAERLIVVETFGGLGAASGRVLRVDSTVAGAGELHVVGGGTTVLHNTWNSYGGGTRLTSGVLNITNETLGEIGGGLRFDGGTLQVSGSGLMTLRDRKVTLMPGGGTIHVDANRTLAITNEITGSGRLVKTGTGWLVLSTSNDYSGGTIVAGVSGHSLNSRIYATHSDAFGRGVIVSTNGGQIFLAGGLSITNPLVFHGGDASTSYNGALQATGGVVVLGGPISVSSALTRLTVWNSATIRVTNGIYGVNGINFSAQNGSFFIENVPIVSSASDIFFFSGGNNNLGTNYLNVGGNVFTNARIWQGGLLVLGLANALPTNVNLTIGDPTTGDTAGTLDLNGFDQRIGNLTSGITNLYRSFVTNRSSTLATFTVHQTVAATNRTTIAGPISFVKDGPATVSMINTNTFTGMARIMNGTLELLTNAMFAAANTIRIDAGATLSVSGRTDRALTLASGQTLSGNGTLLGGLIVGAGATVAPGVSPGALTVTGGDVTFQAGSSFDVEILGTLAGQYDQLLMSAPQTLTLGNATLLVTAPNPLTLGAVIPIISGWGSIDSSTFSGLAENAEFTAGGNVFRVNYGTLTGYEDDVTLTVVPEPATLGLVGLAAAVAKLLRRRLRRQLR